MTQADGVQSGRRGSFATLPAFMNIGFTTLGAYLGRVVVVRLTGVLANAPNRSMLTWLGSLNDSNGQKQCRYFEKERSRLILIWSSGKMLRTCCFEMDGDARPD